MTCIVALEGITKSGKTTQCSLAKTSLEEHGVKAITVPEFTSSAIGKLAEKLAFDQVSANPHAAFLVFVANVWEKSEFAHGIKNLYDVIIIDGFIEQVVAYESVSLNVSLSESSIEWFYSFFDGLPLIPDLNIILHPSLSEVISRLQNCSPAKLDRFKKAYHKFELLNEYLQGKDRYETIYVENMEMNQITSEILRSIERSSLI